MHDFDEVFYVLDGELIFRVEDALEAKGALCLAPRNAAHALANHAGAPARYLLVCRSHRRAAAPARGLSRRASFLLVQLGTHWHRRLTERLAPLDLHPRHFAMLNQLTVNEGQSQQALGRALGIHRSAVSRWSTTWSGAGSPSAAATPPTDARTRST